MKDTRKENNKETSRNEEHSPDRMHLGLMMVDRMWTDREQHVLKWENCCSVCDHIWNLACHMWIIQERKV